MDTQKFTAEYRLSKWAQVIQKQIDSGQNIKDFCETTGISRHAYFYWQKKLRKMACTELAKTEEPKNIAPSGWMQLMPQQPQHLKETLNIEINGCHVIVDSQTNFELLKKVCHTLRSLG